jgi:hypothetical protein
VPNDSTTPRSRRAILAAAAGGAVGALATKLVAPDTAAAAPTAVLTETTTPTTATTKLEGGAPGSFEVFRVSSAGNGPAIQAESATGAGVVGASNAAGLGVVGFSLSGFGVVAISNTGMGLYAATELGLPAVQAGVSIYARATDKTKTGLKAEGRVVLPDRSGRVLIAAGASSATVSRVGVTTANIAVATLAAARTGVWVSSVVCTAGKITIRLNKAVTVRTAVSWIALG